MKQLVGYMVFWIALFFFGMGMFSIFNYTETGKQTVEAVGKVLGQEGGMQ